MRVLRPLTLDEASGTLREDLTQPPTLVPLSLLGGSLIGDTQVQVDMTNYLPRIELHGPNWL